MKKIRKLRLLEVIVLFVIIGAITVLLGGNLSKFSKYYPHPKPIVSTPPLQHTANIPKIAPKIVAVVAPRQEMLETNKETNTVDTNLERMPAETNSTYLAEEPTKNDLPKPPPPQSDEIYSPPPAQIETMPIVFAAPKQSPAVAIATPPIQSAAANTSQKGATILMQRTTGAPAHVDFSSYHVPFLTPLFKVAISPIIIVKENVSQMGGQLHQSFVQTAQSYRQAYHENYDVQRQEATPSHLNTPHTGTAYSSTPAKTTVPSSHHETYSSQKGNQSYPSHR